VSPANKPTGWNFPVPPLPLSQRLRGYFFRLYFPAIRFILRFLPPWRGQVLAMRELELISGEFVCRLAHAADPGSPYVSSWANEVVRSIEALSELRPELVEALPFFLRDGVRETVRRARYGTHEELEITHVSVISVFTSARSSLRTWGDR
jgi:hypothetical protein